jgi:hypothetical protein
MVLSVGGADDYPTLAVQAYKVICVGFVKAYSLECDSHKVWVDRVEGFFHVPGADAAAAAALLYLLL